MITFNIVAKSTGWLMWLVGARTKYYFENRKLQGRIIRKKAIVVSNHNTVWDFGAMLFAFPTRCLRCVVAELMYEKNFVMTALLKWAGTFRVDRNANDFEFMNKCERVLKRGGVVEIYPEARIPLENEPTPLPFKPSAVYLALSTDTPIIPVYTEGNYFTKKRNRLVIGAPINTLALYDESLSEKENVEKINDYVRSKIIELREIAKKG